MLDVVFAFANEREGRINRVKDGAVRWILHRVLAAQENLYKAAHGQESQ